MLDTAPIGTICGFITNGGDSGTGCDGCNSAAGECPYGYYWDDVSVSFGNGFMSRFTNGEP